MPRTILIADDSTTIRRVVEHAFAGTDVRVIGAADGPSALDAIRAERPDAVLCDVLMPGLSGYDVAERLRQDPALADTPVLLLTGAFEPFDEARAAACGAAGFLAKPFESAALRSRVMALIDQRAPAPAPRDEAPAPRPAPTPAAASVPTPALTTGGIARRGTGILLQRWGSVAPETPAPAPPAPSLVPTPAPAPAEDPAATLRVPRRPEPAPAPDHDDPLQVAVAAPVTVSVPDPPPAPVADDPVLERIVREEVRRQVAALAPGVLAEEIRRQLAEIVPGAVATEVGRLAQSAVPQAVGHEAQRQVAAQAPAAIAAEAQRQLAGAPEQLKNAIERQVTSLTPGAVGAEAHRAVAAQAPELLRRAVAELLPRMLERALRRGLADDGEPGGPKG